MLTKATSSIDRLEVPSDGKSVDLGFGSSASDGTSVKARLSASNTSTLRGTNPWPAPSSRTCGGGFGGSTNKEFCVGFARTSVSRFGKLNGTSAFGNSGFESASVPNFGALGKNTGFEASHRRNTSWQAAGTPVRSTPSEADKDRHLTSPSSESRDVQCSHHGFHGSLKNCVPRLISNSQCRRLRSGRRKSGRRGSDRPGHCFNCGEHGHISKLCPKKLIAAPEEDVYTTSYAISENNGEEPFLGRMIADENSIKSEQIIRQGMFNGTEEHSSYHDEKLENQKARLSYYGCTMNNDSMSMQSASPEVDKFSEQLENALKLSPTVADESRVSPAQSPEKTITTRRGEVFPSSGRPPTPCKTPELPTNDSVDETNENREMSSNSVTIETRRTVMRDGKPYFEECTVVSFPSTLPPNVRVITAQFVPSASQKL